MDRGLRGTLSEEIDPRGSAFGPNGLVLPDYGGACLSEVAPTLLRRHELAEAGKLPGWLPTAAAEADQVVLLVLDGLGWEQLSARAEHAPALSSMEGGPITSVAPTTTATALTSISTGAVPSDHGVLGYRLRVGGELLNVLRWTVHGKDARNLVPPAEFRRLEPFLGRQPPVVSRAEFSGSGFTEVHLQGTHLVGWRMPSSIRVEIDSLVASGEPFVYAYYDGIDKIAHDAGLGEHYAAELSSADRLVSDILSDLPERCALVVTADHGQVEVRSEPIVLPPEITKDVELLSGEGRFRWLHCALGTDEQVLERCRARYEDVAWVKHREELFDEGWYGGRPDAELASRLGDVALIPFAPVAFFDPSDTGELRLVARHGSLTSAEMLVPLVAWAP
ncbi:MAG: putative Type phosphodiesterase/nucleotide pyrophosphatase [Acidimicrobiaceae bacterium]|nr:putative Type phosphodiesterase/nucleotide pyrophosphatase [Acidimicrobiaceae bacterium]